jgi:hypothetical protein
MNAPGSLAIFGIVVASIALTASLFYKQNWPASLAVQSPLGQHSQPNVPSPATPHSIETDTAIEPSGSPPQTEVIDHTNDTGATSEDLSTTTEITEAFVLGKTKFTDPDFGFSFWYPSTWTISQSKSTSGREAVEGAEHVPSNIIKEIELKDLSGNEFFFDEMYSKSGYITSPAARSCSSTFFFNDTTNAWMEGAHGCDSEGTTTVILEEGAPYTDGGLPIFDGADGSFEYFVPLSKHKFINISFIAEEYVEAAVYELNPLPIIQTVELYPDSKSAN